jgi:hypothetical protein
LWVDIDRGIDGIEGRKGAKIKPGNVRACLGEWSCC